MLHMTGILGLVEISEYLLTMGADPDRLNSFGRSPLHKSIEANQLSTSRVFLTDFASHSHEVNVAY